MDRLISCTGGLLRWSSIRTRGRNGWAHLRPCGNRNRRWCNFRSFRRGRDSNWFRDRRWRRWRNHRLGFHHGSGWRWWRSLNRLRYNRNWWRSSVNYWSWRGRRGSNNNRSGGLHSRCFGRGFLGCLVRYFLLFRRNFRVSERAKMFAHLYRCGYFNGAGVRFFLSNAGFRQIVDNCLCLDFEFTSQLIDTDLIRISHCPPGPLLISVLA
jgi:hypothetical protein